MNKFSKFAVLFLVVVVLCLTGCGKKAKVTGTVKFSDGTPLNVGTVNFTDGTNLFRGEIQPDGTFEMRTFKPGDGVLKGSYKVYLTETLQFGATGKRVLKPLDMPADRRLRHRQRIRRFGKTIPFDNRDENLQLPDAEIDHGNPSKLLRIHHSKGSVA